MLLHGTAKVPGAAQDVQLINKAQDPSLCGILFAIPTLQVSLLNAEY